MTESPNLFSRVRIKPTAEEAVAESENARCQHPGCQRVGTYRAPKGRFREGEYWRFCLEHVQEYNKTYNYFAGMSDDAVQAFQKDAITGHRPTWSMGTHSTSMGPDGKPIAPDVADPLGVFTRARRQPAPEPEPTGPRIGKVARKAFEVLGLDPGSDRDTIRARYKALVKRLHPDANNGDRSREDKLREIINAYNTLKSAGHA